MKRCCIRGGKLLVALSVLLCCCACPVSGEKHATTEDSHTSLNALDWAGTYTGMLPCADCIGIETILTLTPARTYELQRRYMGRQEVGEEFVCSGVFEWSSDGDSIELHGLQGERVRFQVGENHLFALDQAGKRIEGELAQAYTLSRSAVARADDYFSALKVFAGTAWHLVELQGATLAPQESAAWMAFETDPARVHGFSGCNRFFGAYQSGLDPQIQGAGNALPLKFDQMGTTMMACPPMVMRYEDEFLTMLTQVAGVYVARKSETQNRVEGKNKTRERHWRAGSVLVFVDSTHRIIARFRAETEV